MIAAAPQLNRAQRRKMAKRQAQAPVVTKRDRQDMSRAWAEAERLKELVEMDQEQADKVALFARLAMDRLCTGKGSLEDVVDLQLAYNVSLLLAETVVGEEMLPVIEAAREPLLRAEERAKAGSPGFDGPGMMAVRAMLDVHDAQLEAKPNVGDMRVVFQKIREAIANGDKAAGGRLLA